MLTVFFQGGQLFFGTIQIVVYYYFTKSSGLGLIGIGYVADIFFFVPLTVNFWINGETCRGRRAAFFVKNFNLVLLVFALASSLGNKIAFQHGMSTGVYYFGYLFALRLGAGYTEISRANFEFMTPFMIEGVNVFVNVLTLLIVVLLLIDFFF